MSFTVNRTQLDRTADDFGIMHTSAGQTQQTIQAIPLGESDFGRVPWLNTRVWEAYDEHRTACLASMTELTGALQNVSEGLHATSAAYRQMDEDAEKAAEFITKSLQAGPK